MWSFLFHFPVSHCGVGFLVLLCWEAVHFLNVPVFGAYFWELRDLRLCGSRQRLCPGRVVGAARVMQ